MLYCRYCIVLHCIILSAFLAHLRARGHNTAALMLNIEELVVKSFFSVAFTVNSACKMFVPHRNNCFELYGFDILVDQQLKPWLLEASSRSVGFEKKKLCR